MMGNFTKKHRWEVLWLFVLTVISQGARAQSGSFGSTYVHTGMEMGILGQHDFVTGSGTINAGIVGSERLPVIGVYSFVNPAGSWINASNTAFMDGYVRTYNSGPFTFPIGDNNKYRPAAVSASSAAAPTTAAYYGVDPGSAMTSDLKGGTYGILPGGGPAFPTTSKAATVGVVDNVEYWDIDGTTPARITLTWDANTPIASMVGDNLNNLTIVGWDGTKWVAIPSTVDPASLTLTTSASAFTGLGPQITAGSITTNATVVPGSFTVYTLAGSCPTTNIIADLTSQTICSGNQVAINYTTTPTGGQTIWTRMPGNLTSLGNVVDFPTATGSTPTTYTYTAAVTSFGCPSLTAVTTVLVNPVPIVTPSFCSQTICSGQTGAITFTTTIPGSTIHWVRTPTSPAPSSGTGDISQSLINTGPTSLTYTYQVWAESPAPASCPSSTTITCTIVVDNCCDLVATATPTAVTSCVTPNSGAVVLTYIGSQTYQYSLNGGAFQALGTSPFTISNLAANTYSIAIQAVGDPTCSTVVSATVSGPVVPNLTASSNSPVCTGNTLTLFATSGFATYTWSGPNGFSSTQQNPVLPISTTVISGAYSVSATTAAGCTVTASTTVIVATQPNLTVTAGTGLTICSGQSTTLAVAGDGGATVTWINSLGQTGTGTTINFGGLLNLVGQPQSVTYIVSANAGPCSDTETVVLTINPAPVVQVNPQQAIICDLEQTNIVATAFPSTATLDWVRSPALPNPPPATGTGTGSLTVNQVLPPGSYTFTFTATQGGCTSSPVTVPLTVNN
ncbi:hypothetical protein ACS5NO_31945 [Larkinella sp. GY13]|uniref:hypothetical protein n=1 Tax=Larkinella sp. GY13 TaxID=3453720 RepID=UPI003EE95E34